VTTTFSGGQTRTAQQHVVRLVPTIQLTGDSLLCPGATLTLVGSAPNATAYHWNNGVSTAAMTVSQPGTYTFTAQYGSGCSASRRVVVRFATLTITGGLPPLCQGSNRILSAVAPGATAYHWNTGATTPTLTVSQAGSYSVVASFPSGCTLNASQAVTQSLAAIRGDSVGCPGQAVLLTAAQPDALAYRWNTGALTPSIQVTESGTYSVVVTYRNGCQGNARQQVRLRPRLLPLSLGADTTLCEGTALLLQPMTSVSGAGVTYRWSTGAITPTLVVHQAGTYSLELTTACETRTLSRRISYQPCLLVPNIITPNGDQRNDRFVVAGLTGNWVLELYSRWGQQVYRAATYHNDWGEGATPGVYYYFLYQSGNTTTYKGWLEVVR
jgi:hypothetical protein